MSHCSGENMHTPLPASSELTQNRLPHDWGRDREQEKEMRPYRALARALEPYLHEEPGSRDITRRWQRRFLD